MAHLGTAPVLYDESDEHSTHLRLIEQSELDDQQEQQWALHQQAAKLKLQQQRERLLLINGGDAPPSSQRDDARDMSGSSMSRKGSSSSSTTPAASPLLTSLQHSTGVIHRTNSRRANDASHEVHTVVSPLQLPPSIAASSSQPHPPHQTVTNNNEREFPQRSASRRASSSQSSSSSSSSSSRPCSQADVASPCVAPVPRVAGAAAPSCHCSSRSPSPSPRINSSPSPDMSDPNSSLNYTLSPTHPSPLLRRFFDSVPVVSVRSPHLVAAHMLINRPREDSSAEHSTTSTQQSNTHDTRKTRVQDVQLASMSTTRNTSDKEEPHPASHKHKHIHVKPHSGGSSSLAPPVSPTLRPESRGSIVSRKPKWAQDVKENPELAAVYIRDALYYWNCDHYTDGDKLKLYKIFRSAWYRRVLFCVVMAIAFLSYFELTSWFRHAQENSATDDNYQYVWLLHACEFVLMMAIFSHSAFRYFAERASILTDPWWRASVVLIACMLVDLIVNCVLPTSPRVTRIARIYFLVNWNFDTRAQAKQIVGTVIQMGPPFVMLFFLVFFQTIVSCLFFHEPDVETDPHRPYMPEFDNVYNSYYTTFFMLAAVNFPEVSFPAIEHYNLSVSLVFVLILISSTYISLNLIIALVYSVYRQHAVVDLREKWKTRQQALMLAFGLMDTQRSGYIELKQWKTVAAFLQQWGVIPNQQANQFMCVRAITHQQINNDVYAELYFKLIDERNEGRVNLQNFYNLCENLFLRFGIVPPHEEMSHSRKLVLKYFEHPYVQLFRAFLMFVNALMLLFPFTRCQDSSCMYDPLSIFIIDNIFMLYHCGEIVTNRYIFGSWRRYFLFGPNAKWRQMSFSIVLVSLFGKVLIECILQPLEPASLRGTMTLMRWAMFFRTIRLVRIVPIIPPIRQGLSNVIALMSSMSTSFTFILIIYYVFAVLGNYIFSGLIANDTEVLQHTLFHELRYPDIINFNSLTNSLYTLFHIMNLTNWQISTRAFVLVTGPYAMVYFIAFFVIVNLVALNLIVALVIEGIRHTNAQAAHAEHDDLAVSHQLNIGGQDANSNIKYELIGNKHMVHDAKLELFKQELQE